jgi:short-subunit dehydrogenase
MTPTLKNLEDQVLVITGASSGIGLTTARMAAENGSRLVLAARSASALRQLTDEITQKGGEAIHVVADVRNREEVEGISQAARETFGGFDTWINNAGVSIYGNILDVPIDEMRRLFETNFWGYVYGSLEAARHLRQKGGALINVGSTVSERAIPLQGMYCASKQAIKGFTEVLRMELEAEGAPVSVTLVKPGPIDTPYTLNAKNYLEVEPQQIPPVYSPDPVARAILRAAEIPTRHVYVGGSGAANAAMGHLAPRLTDKYMERVMISGTKSDRPARPRERNALDQPSERLAERGDYHGRVAGTSAFARASQHPVLTGAALVGAGVVATTLLKSPRDDGWRGRA